MRAGPWEPLSALAHRATSFPLPDQPHPGPGCVPVPPGGGRAAAWPTEHLFSCPEPGWWGPPWATLSRPSLLAQHLLFSLAEDVGPKGQHCAGCSQGSPRRTPPTGQGWVSSQNRLGTVIQRPAEGQAGPLGGRLTPGQAVLGAPGGRGGSRGGDAGPASCACTHVTPVIQVVGAGPRDGLLRSEGLEGQSLEGLTQDQRLSITPCYPGPPRTWASGLPL